MLKKFVWTKERCAVPEASVPASVEPVEQLGSALRFRPGYSDPMLGHEAAGWSLDSDGSTYAWPRTPAAGGCHPWQGL